MMSMDGLVRPLNLFEGYGIELEYMIVHEETLDVLPVSDEVIGNVAGSYVNEVETGRLAWSNELVLHVIEVKTNGPSQALEGLPELFIKDLSRIGEILKPLNGLLMPTGMHPWMDPLKETRLWPHEYDAIYGSYNRIFGAKGHGWSNLQSMHVNLPFSNEEEFVRLHSAIRLILPLIPALAASTPVMDGVLTGIRDNRMEVYRHNQEKIPSIASLIVPEAIRSTSEYHDLILEPMYRDIAPYDPEGILQEEWLNSRGAIARFERSAIEIRTIDIQECPLMDLSTAALIVETVKALVSERWSSLEEQLSMPTGSLSDILLGTIRLAEDFAIQDTRYLRLLGAQDMPGGTSAGCLWRYLLRECMEPSSVWYGALEAIMREGTLATRITRRLGPGFTRDDLKKVYRELCGGLMLNEFFSG